MHLSNLLPLSALILFAAASPITLHRRQINSNSGVSAAQIAVILQKHNDLRAKYGEVALTWDANYLAQGAQSWADMCPGDHSRGSSDGSYGENIAGPWDIPDPDVSGLVDGWLEEESRYDWNDPGYNRKGNGQDVQTGHFTAIVWKSTTQVGCGLTRCLQGSRAGQGWYLVCRYFPAGNYPDQFVAQVPRAGSGNNPPSSGNQNAPGTQGAGSSQNTGFRSNRGQRGRGGTFQQGGNTQTNTFQQGGNTQPNTFQQGGNTQTNTFQQNPPSTGTNTNTGFGQNSGSLDFLSHVGGNNQQQTTTQSNQQQSNPQQSGQRTTCADRRENTTFQYVGETGQWLTWYDEQGFTHRCFDKTN